MAERRMFAKTIVLSDAFLDMPLSARCLYFTLGMFADDDGFVNSPKGIMRQCGASEDDLKVLIAKKFVLVFESGVMVIKHWRINNYLRGDRYKETKHLEEKENLTTDKNGVYSLFPSGCQVVADCLPQDRLGKDKLEKDIITDSDEPETPTPKKDKPTKHKYGEYKNVLLTDEELEKLQKEYPDYQERIERLSSYVASTGKSYKSHYATIRNWARNDKKKVVNTGYQDNLNDLDHLF